VTFHPQEWVDTPGRTPDRNGARLIPARDRDPVSFRVPRADATDESGSLFANESYRANGLRDHRAAPTWVSEWDGPYRILTADG